MDAAALFSRLALALLLLVVPPAHAQLDACDVDVAAAQPCGCGQDECALGDTCSSVTQQCVEQDCARLLLLAANRSSYILMAEYTLTEVCVVPDEIDILSGTMKIVRGENAPADEEVGVARPEDAAGKYRLFTVSKGSKLVLDGVTVSGGEVTAAEPEDCSSDHTDGCGSGGIVRVLGGTLQTRGNATFAQGVAARQGGAVYVGSGGVFYMEGPTKFIENEVTQTQGVSGSLSAVERTWLDATVTAATGGVEMFDGGSGNADEKFPGHLHVAPDGKLVISRPKTFT